ncbi:MAG: DUF262 domain-containing protein, partial [Myxococcaceae bacterium]|nr:DUF262 domain-containing protein [Myxococcaceae bacterium]
GGLWSDAAQSRLIESLLIRIPLPAFYMDATNEERWLVVDGLQRLSVLKRFIIDQDLALTGLEFLINLRGKRFSELPRPLQRRIEETQLIVYLIQPGTPPNLKFNIFERINTGGLPLSAQEIRHALNQGPAALMLERLAGAPAFERVVGRSIRTQRMTDREFVLRFLAFVLTPPETYRSQDLDGFLNQQMGVLNAMSDADRAALEGRFLRAMDAAWRLFEKDAFRKRYRPEDPRKPVNKALFEAWAVTLDALSDAELELLVQRRETLRDRLMAVMNRDSGFVDSISRSTGDVRNVRLRFSTVRALAREVLDAAAS